VTTTRAGPPSYSTLYTYPNWPLPRSPNVSKCVAPLGIEVVVRPTLTAARLVRTASSAAISSAFIIPGPAPSQVHHTCAHQDLAARRRPVPLTNQTAKRSRKVVPQSRKAAKPRRTLASRASSTPLAAVGSRYDAIAHEEQHRTAARVCSAQRGRQDIDRCAALQWRRLLCAW
jgi:hypothetical protein